MQEAEPCFPVCSLWLPWLAFLHNPVLLLKGAAILYSVVPSTPLSIKEVLAGSSSQVW